MDDDPVDRIIEITEWLVWTAVAGLCLLPVVMLCAEVASKIASAF